MILLKFGLKKTLFLFIMKKTMQILRIVCKNEEKIMKKKPYILLALSAAICLTGCGSEAAIETDTLALSKSGTAAYSILSDFSKDYYDLEELKALAEEEITEYGTGVSISQANVEEGMLHFQYTFDTLSDYASFMDTRCYSATVAKALKDGYKSTTEVVSVKDGTVKTLGDEKLSEYHLFIWNEDIAVRCSGKVLYHSSNLTLLNKTDVQPVEDATGPYYVIYK